MSKTGEEKLTGSLKCFIANYVKTCLHQALSKGNYGRIEEFSNPTNADTK